MYILGIKITLTDYIRVAHSYNCLALQRKAFILELQNFEACFIT
jgi:hypothetical protein